MQLQDLMQNIANKQVPQFMIWFGEEQVIQDMYLNQISKLGYVKTSCNSVSSALQKTKKTMLGNNNKLLVVRDDADFVKAEKKWVQVQNLINNTNHILVLKYSSLNKTTKFYKQNKNVICEFQKLNEDILEKYILQKVPDFKYSQDLIELCNKDYGRILLELNKMANMRVSDYNRVFIQLLEENAIYKELGDITFKLTDAVCYGNIKSTFKYLEEAKLKDEPVLRIASILYTQFRNLLQWQGLGKNKQNAKERTGLTGWQIKKCIDMQGAYSISELQRNMKICQKVESGIKLGKLNNEIALDYLIINCIK